MKIAIIGTGNVGSALGSSFTKAGHEVTFAAQDTQKTQAVARELGASAAESPVEAAREADVIVLAVPFAAVEQVAAEVAPVAGGKVLVDVTNPLKTDYSGLATAGGPSAAERVAASAPGTKVVKAFNTLFSSVQADPGSTGTTPDGLLAGDDDAAKHTVAELEKSIGLRPVDAGTLAEASTLEALAWLNIGLQLRNGGRWNSAFVIVNPPEQAIAA